jgi:hypothetical protein
VVVWFSRCMDFGGDCVEVIIGNICRCCRRGHKHGLSLAGKVPATFGEEDRCLGLGTLYPLFGSRTSSCYPGISYPGY